MSVLWRLHCETCDEYGPWLRLSAESAKPTLRAYDPRWIGEHEWADFLLRHEFCPKTLEHE